MTRNENNGILLERDFRAFSSISVHQRCVDLIAERVSHSYKIISTN